MTQPNKSLVFVSMLSLFIGGGSGAGTVYYLGPSVVRPDPFTGSDGQKLKDEIVDLRLRLTILENRKLPPQWLTNEVKHLHREVKTNTESIRRIERGER